MTHEELVFQYETARQTLTTFEKRVSDFESRSAALEAKNAKLQQQLDWFHKQYFGKKAERLNREDGDDRQLSLGYEPEETPPAPTVTVKEYERKCRKEPVQFAEDESRLKFESTVPVQVVSVPVPETEGLSPD